MPPADILGDEKDARRPLTVSELTERIQFTLEGAFATVWVVGEITDLSRPQSGHIYLSLKDAGARLPAVVWRSVAGKLDFDPKDGQEVICQGDISVYPPHGKYQLVIRRMEPRGLGALQLALKKLHAKLAAEGLFDPVHKKPLPRFPRQIAFVTSPTGAAIRDFLEVLRRRWQAVHVWVVPVRVQGEGAAREIADAVRLVNRLATPPDVCIVGRGGGSPEDLWCFNEEEVVRAIFASRVPVVSAVGHEIDITLSDLAADLRALTPSEAAERVVPSGDDVRRALDSLRQRVTTGVRSRLAQSRWRVDAVAASRPFRRPYELVRDRERRLDEVGSRLSRAIENRLMHSRQRVAALASRLEALNPRAVLGRGYSITLRADDGSLVVDASTVAPGEQITTRLARGEMTSRVEDRILSPDDED
jgi:exodeoxyribonuclease VII large subunit